VHLAAADQYIKAGDFTKFNINSQYWQQACLVFAVGAVYIIAYWLGLGATEEEFLRVWENIVEQWRRRKDVSIIPVRHLVGRVVKLEMIDTNHPHHFARKAAAFIYCYLGLPPKGVVQKGCDLPRDELFDGMLQVRAYCMVAYWNLKEAGRQGRYVKGIDAKMPGCELQLWNPYCKQDGAKRWFNVEKDFDPAGIVWEFDMD